MTSKLAAPRSRSSRDRAGVSHERAGLPAIQSRMAECQVGRAMIGAVPALTDCLLTRLLTGCAGYTLAYRCSYPVVYTQVKEVS
jgi:hypothetical protein